MPRPLIEDGGKRMSLDGKVMFTDGGNKVILGFNFKVSTQPRRKNVVAHIRVDADNRQGKQYKELTELHTVQRGNAVMPPYAKLSRIARVRVASLVRKKHKISGHIEVKVLGQFNYS